MTDLHWASMASLAEQLATKKLSSIELTQALLARMQKTQGLNAYVHEDAKLALAMAQASDERRQKSETLGPLDGIPMGLKDIFCTTDAPTRCASNILGEFVAPYDAHVVKLLREAGVVFLGKLNMDEFAMGSSNEHSRFGPTKNPWDTARTPGGSSGGSAAAVSAGSSVVTLGTDTGGSIRQPAAMCGIVGLKPTYGRVSRRGVIAYASSFDQVGPMARNVRDCAQLLKVISGHDPLDMTSSTLDVPDYESFLKAGVRGLKIGVPKQYHGKGIDPEVARAIEEALGIFASLGATLKDVSLPHTDHGIATYYVLAPAEASSNLARYDGVRFGFRAEMADTLEAMYTNSRSEGFGDEVKRRVMLGSWLLSAGHFDAYYTRAQQVRTLVCRDFQNVFEDVDVLLTPTTPAPAFPLGGNDVDPLQMYLADVFTVPANLAGIPGISLPCGQTSNQLPIGLQLLAKPFAEQTLLTAAAAFEEATDWHTKRAPL